VFFHAHVIYIKIKFEIEINNDEVLWTIWENKKGKNDFNLDVNLTIRMHFTQKKRKLIKQEFTLFIYLYIKNGKNVKMILHEK